MTKGRILVISFHFYPSAEIGAKRPSETALYLLRQGYDVTVLCARQDPSATVRVGGALDGLNMLTVKVPRRIWTQLYIKCKSLIRRRSPPAATAPAPAGK